MANSQCPGRYSTVTPFYNEKTDSWVSECVPELHAINRWMSQIYPLSWSKAFSIAECWLFFWSSFTVLSDLASLLLNSVEQGNSKARFRGRGNRLHILVQRIVCVCKNGWNCWQSSLQTIYWYLISHRRKLRPEEVRPLVSCCTVYMAELEWKLSCESPSSMVMKRGCWGDILDNK